MRKKDRFFYINLHVFLFIVHRKMEIVEGESIIENAKDAKRARDENVTKASTQMEKKRKFVKDEQISDDDTTSTIFKENDNNGQLQLDDINNDCLRHIFEFLSLRDLIKTAQTTDQFEFAAAEAFSRRYRKQRIEVLVTSKPIHMFCRFGYLRIDGALAMAGLRFFGARMSTLSANFDSFQSITPANSHPINVEILNNCLDSLRTFEINFCIETHFETIDKPFKNVENLVINGCALGAKFAELSKWFPSILHLELAGVKLLHYFAIETPFVHLTSLNIINDTDAKIPEQTIQEILRQNRQLKSLLLRCVYGVELLLIIMKYLMQLETLELWTPTDGFASCTADQKITFVMLKTLILHALPQVDTVVKMPFALKNVNELRLYGFDQYNPLIVTLIASGDQLNAITLSPFQQRSPSQSDYEALKQALLTRRQLTELQLCVNAFYSDDLKHFIDECKHLKELRLMTMNLAGIQSVQIGNEWYMSEPDIKIQFIDLENRIFEHRFLIYYYLVLKRKN